jgi:hypothetical protein
MSGEVTLRIDDEVTVGGSGPCAFIARGVLRATQMATTAVAEGRGRRRRDGASCDRAGWRSA